MITNIKFFNIIFLSCKTIEKEKVIYEDETPTTVNGKIMSAICVFTKEFRIEFTNNLAERGLKKIKTK